LSSPDSEAASSTKALPRDVRCTLRGRPRAARPRPRVADARAAALTRALALPPWALALPCCICVAGGAETAVGLMSGGVVAEGSIGTDTRPKKLRRSPVTKLMMGAWCSLMCRRAFWRWFSI
jgi:hypothetical protein